VLEIVAEATNADEAMSRIQQMKPDVVFLDINMPGKTGFDLLTQLKVQPFLVFTTAYEQYAIEAFKTNSVDYLLKPIEEERFAQCIAKLLRFANGPIQSIDFTEIRKFVSALQENKSPTAIPIKIGEKFIFLRLEEVVFLEAKDKYVYVNTSSGKEYLSDTRLSAFEQTLPANFIRVQKSFIINKECILEMHKHFGNRLVMTMNNKAKTRITSGNTYINQIRTALGL
jgi:two-component system LytT family response regulator